MQAKQLLVVTSLVVATAAHASEWEIDPAHSSAQFSVRHLMLSNVRGEFAKLAGTVRLDDRTPLKSSVEATIDASSLSTREAKRDAHLKSADFLDVAKFPTITFRSKRVEADGTRYRVLGDLTLHGVTKDVALALEPSAEAKDLQGNVRRGALATTSFSRKDFGLKWNVPLEGGGVLVGDKVDVTLDLQFVKKAAKP